MRNLRWLFAMLVAVALAPVALLAQEPAVVTGRVTNAAGAPENAVLVRIDALNVGTTTSADGSYRLVVPASRVRAGQQVTVTASRVGLAASSRQITLNPGATLTQNFTLGADVLQLEALVATGQGTVQERRAVASTINSVSGQLIENSNEDNVVAALAGKAPNVQVTTSSGDPGAGSYITIRGTKTISGDTQPLFVVDGVPIDNSTIGIEGAEAGTQVQNRAADINPNDIENIEILKGAAAAAIYGSRAANGVVLITTKSGKRGSTRISFKSSYSNDEVNNFVPLQTRYGQGLINPANPLVNTSPNNVRSWGPELAAGTPVYNHADELFDTGNQWENNLTLSGGSDRTTYFLSLGNLSQDGVLKGNSAYDRSTVRLKGDHSFTDKLRVGGNFAYTRSEGDLVQQGSNTSGVMLGALRTPPNFNNCRSEAEGGFAGKCWLNAAGLQFSYRTPNPTSITQLRGFDNPFWVLNDIRNTSNVGRFFGNVNLEYQALPWLNVSYVLGADYANDERLTVLPKSSSDYPDGRMIRADLLTEQYDHSLLATANYTLGSSVTGSVTVGQNLNQQEFSRYQVNGFNLIFGTDQLDFAIDKTPNEFRSKVRTDGYFVQATADVFDRLFLTGALRADGSSTFGGDGKRFVYPKVSAAYDFSTLGFLDRVLDFGKLRAAYGVAGTQPPVYSNVTGFTTATFPDSWLTGGLYTIYGGNEGVVSSATLGNEDIEPERTSEFEAGFDLAVLDSRVSLGVTYYNSKTTDAIIGIQIPASTGFQAVVANAAAFDNKGWEVTLDLNPVQRENVSWTLGVQWAHNQGCVRDLAGSEEFSLNGFTGSTSSLVAPERDANGNITTCYDYGTLYGQDWVRFGRGLTVGGVNIDQAFPNAEEGAIYIAANGFPLRDPQSRVTGDPNPDWTGSLRSSLTLFNNLQISGLLDVKHGGDMWNGTRGALQSYGTHAVTEPWHGAGQSGVVFGENYFQNEAVGGPGAGTAVTLNQVSWGFNGLGNGFNGPMSQFVEDAGFVKLRDITLSYTLDQPFVKRYGFSSAELTVSGRNLKTWTDYTGIDPESNLTGQSAGRGLDYFNNPRTRSWVFSVTLNR
jgi:TonB-linked SusC/RagA family outer membrane protein